MKWSSFKIPPGYHVCAYSGYSWKSLFNIQCLASELIIMIIMIRCFFFYFLFEFEFEFEFEFKNICTAQFALYNQKNVILYKKLLICAEG